MALNCIGTMHSRIIFNYNHVIKCTCQFLMATKSKPMCRNATLSNRHSYTVYARNSNYSLVGTEHPPNNENHNA